MLKTIVLILSLGAAVIAAYVFIPNTVHKTVTRTVGRPAVKVVTSESLFGDFSRKQRILHEEKFSEGIQGYWELAELKDAPLEQILEFHLDIYRGGYQKACWVATSCNDCWVNLNVRDSEASFSGFRCTLRGCGERGEWGKNYVGLLLTVRSYELTSRDLIFFNDVGERVARYRRYRGGTPERGKPTENSDVDYKSLK